jgi:hypothetical protein
MPHLENWSVNYTLYDVFAAPEGVRKHLCGYVYGHTSHDDGKRVATSAIEDIDTERKLIKTRSGSNYTLGEPNPAWIEWLNSEGIYDNFFPHFSN